MNIELSSMDPPPEFNQNRQLLFWQRHGRDKSKIEKRKAKEEGTILPSGILGKNEPHSNILTLYITIK
jgi:hypothetical protein